MIFVTTNSSVLVYTGIACLQAVVCIRARVRRPANPVAILDELVADLGRAREKNP